MNIPVGCPRRYFMMGRRKTGNSLSGNFCTGQLHHEVTSDECRICRQLAEKHVDKRAIWRVADDLTNQPTNQSINQSINQS